MDKRGVEMVNQEQQRRTQDLNLQTKSLETMQSFDIKRVGIPVVSQEFLSPSAKLTHLWL
jgi:hypothetical protein